MLDVATYKTQLLALKSEISSRANAIEKDLHHAEHAVEKDFAEQATQLENDEVLSALDNEAKNTLIEINSALLRIENNVYGICTECHTSIPQQRLDITPYASRCIKCAD